MPWPTSFLQNYLYRTETHAFHAVGQRGKRHRSVRQGTVAAACIDGDGEFEVEIGPGVAEGFGVAATHAQEPLNRRIDTGSVAAGEHLRRRANGPQGEVFRILLLLSTAT